MNGRREGGREEREGGRGHRHMRVIVYVYTRDMRVQTKVSMFPISTVSVYDRF